jgi:hypothetical protein
MQSRLVSFASVGFIVGPVVGGHMAEMENGFHYVCCIAMLFFLINFGKRSAYTLQADVKCICIITTES